MVLVWNHGLFFYEISLTKLLNKFRFFFTKPLFSLDVHHLRKLDKGKEKARTPQKTDKTGQRTLMYFPNKELEVRWSTNVYRMCHGLRVDLGLEIEMIIFQTLLTTFWSESFFGQLFLVVKIVSSLKVKHTITGLKYFQISLWIKFFEICFFEDF